MKNRIAVVVLVAGLLPFATFAQSAAPSGPSKVAMIDISRAVLSTTEGKAALDELNKKFEPRKADVQKQTTEVQDLQKQLREGSKLSADARADLAKSLEQKRLALQYASETVQADFRRERAEIIGRVLKKMAPIIDKFGRDNGYTMIFDAQFWPTGPVLWASGPAADITGAIITAYNALPASAASTPSGGGTPQQ